jgi:hypothetical protein
MADPRTPCVRCTQPEATAADLKAWNDLQEASQPLPPGWDDAEGSNLCWRTVARGECVPDGPTLRVTAGRLVLHDDDFTLLSAPVEDVIAALREAGALSGPTDEEHTAELAQLRADLAAAQDRLTWPRWVHRRAERTMDLWLPSHELLAVVWDAYDEEPAGWRAWHAPLGSGPPCPWEQGAGGIDEAEAYLVKYGRIRPGCTIRPVSG